MVSQHLADLSAEVEAQGCANIRAHESYLALLSARNEAAQALLQSTIQNTAPEEEDLPLAPLSPAPTLTPAQTPSALETENARLLAELQELKTIMNTGPVQAATKAAHDQWAHRVELHPLDVTPAAEAAVPRPGREKDLEITLDFVWNFFQDEAFNSFKGGVAPVTVQDLAPGGPHIFSDFIKHFLGMKVWAKFFPSDKTDATDVIPQQLLGNLRRQVNAVANLRTTPVAVTGDQVDRATKVSLSAIAAAAQRIGASCAPY